MFAAAVEQFRNLKHTYLGSNQKLQSANFIHTYVRFLDHNLHVPVCIYLQEKSPRPKPVL